MSTMIKSISVFLFCAFVSTVLVGQDHDAKIRASFNEYSKALIDVNLDKLLTFAHPNIVRLGGGAHYYIDELRDEYNMYSAAGLKIKEIDINVPSKILTAPSGLQGMVSYTRTLINESGKALPERHFFLLTSQDNGMTWKFTDMKKYDAKSLKLFIPDYNERLNIYLNSINH